MNLLANSKNLKRLVRLGKLTVAVYGLGYVGASIAAVWLRAGARVIGVDKSEEVIKMASKGVSPVDEPIVSQTFKAGIRKKLFTATTDSISASKMSDLKIIAVPVGLSNSFADLLSLNDVTLTISKGLKKGDVVSVNPSIPPGTTENLVLPILEKESGLRAEKKNNENDVL